MENNDSSKIDILMKASQEGNAMAQYYLGEIYMRGYETDVDNEKAAYWYRKAAENGVVEAQLKYGLFCEEGMGMEKNYEEAVKWYRSAAKKGNADAQHRLGNCYREGNGVRMDLDEARKWYTKAAEQGNETSVKGLLLIDWMIYRDEESTKNVDKDMTYEEYLKLPKRKSAKKFWTKKKEHEIKDEDEHTDLSPKKKYPLLRKCGKAFLIAVLTVACMWLSVWIFVLYSGDGKIHDFEVVLFAMVIPLILNFLLLLLVQRKKWL